jgi:hypothetical protein
LGGTRIFLLRRDLDACFADAKSGAGSESSRAEGFAQVAWAKSIDHSHFAEYPGEFSVGNFGDFYTVTNRVLAVASFTALPPLVRVCSLLWQIIRVGLKSAFEARARA